MSFHNDRLISAASGLSSMVGHPFERLGAGREREVRLIANLFRKRAAKRLHARGLALEKEGKPDDAIEAYLEAIAKDPRRADSHYNIGLIHKYRGEWRQSYAFNHRANQLDPTDEAARWNLAIAATALRDWAMARKMWAAQGIALTGEGPIEGTFGIAPVRLRPFGDAEVVWARRIDPARARIENIPFPTSGFRYHDVVLNDGAPVGTRMHEGREYAVFNVLALFEQSEFATFEAEIEIGDDADLDALEHALESSGASLEDWSRNVRLLCRQCSEGHPHEQHDRDLERDPGARRVIGIAACPELALEGLVGDWTRGGERRLISLRSVEIDRNAGGDPPGDSQG
jgi:tetratricopeptide (TPR) repeat protein